MLIKNVIKYFLILICFICSHHCYTQNLNIICVTGHQNSYELLNSIIVPDSAFVRIVITFIIPVVLLFIFLMLLSISRKRSKKLESLVTKNTKDLRQAYKHLEEQKEEIHQQAEALLNTNTILQKQKDELTKSYDNIRVLSEFGQKITSTLSLEAINSMIYDYVGSLMDTSAFGIGVYNRDKDQIDYIGFMENGKRVPRFFNKLSEKNSLSAWSFNNQKEVFINDYVKEHNKYIKNDINAKTKEIPQSMIYVPLSIHNKPIGTITVQSNNKNAYTDRDIFILRTLGSYISIALNNATTYTELQQTKEKLVVQNKELEGHRFNLEKQVKVRTAALEVAKEKAEESDRLKSAFLTNLSHEIRTPMNAIIGFSNMLTDSNIQDKDKLEAKELINSSCQNLLFLINEILDVSKIETGYIEIQQSEFSINKLLDELYVYYQNELRNKGKDEVKLKISNVLKKDIKIISDPLRIKQILSNILSNAIKFTYKGTIEYGFRFIKNNSFIEFFVSDTGTGIAKKNMDIIFKSFMKINEKRFHEGAGLGLSIAKTLVNLLGGDINVESKINQGSTFYFTVPLNGHI